MSAVDTVDSCNLEKNGFPSPLLIWNCGCGNAENNQNETAGGQENTLLFGFIATVVWVLAAPPLPPRGSPPRLRGSLTIFWKD